MVAELVLFLAFCAAVVVCSLTCVAVASMVRRGFPVLSLRTQWWLTFAAVVAPVAVWVWMS